MFAGQAIPRTPSGVRAAIECRDKLGYPRYGKLTFKQERMVRICVRKKLRGRR